MATEQALENTKELFAFLQGEAPEGYRIPDGEMPTLTAAQAWTVVLYLGNKYWQVTDVIERCGVCGDLYDSETDGDYLDYGDPPYYFCGPCCEVTAKRVDPIAAPPITKGANCDVRDDTSR